MFLLVAGPMVQAQESSLVSLMTGSFNSERQSQEDAEFYSITLHMYPVWESSDQQWLYVEQAVTAMQDKPYRQRMYLVEELAPDSFRSVVYTLENEEQFIGKWQDPSFFDQFDETILSEREGCAVYLKKTGENEYSGSTLGDACKSTLRGASYATSKVSISPMMIESWDQGFDAEGEQVWGAVKAGYQFDRLPEEEEMIDMQIDEGIEDLEEP